MDNKKLPISAAKAGNFLKKALGWDAASCNAEPTRCKKGK